MTTLQDIQRLQFSDPEAAQDLLLTFIKKIFPVKVREVTLRPLAVSLNSFNGFVTLDDGRRLFFKSHVEPGSVIAEYYNSDLLQGAGYEVISPVMASTVPGQQMLLYELVEDQSVFDAAWGLEQGELAPELESKLGQAQRQADDELWQVYQKSLVWQEAADHANSPIHQLFYHRLTKGRLDEFYGAGTTVTLPGVGRWPLSEVRQMRWEINGVIYEDTLDDVIARAIDLLTPEQAGPAVVGHGDAHNGNVFWRGESLVYFDPAFAGRHDPLLDLVKPFYHNVHAMWMYFPDVLVAERGAKLRIEDDRLVVRFPDDLHTVRDMFWRSKSERVLVPLLRELRAKGWLRSDWRAYLQAGLACCPLLTMNLADGQRFPPPIALLGLAHVIESGAVSENHNSKFEQWLDDVEAAL